MIDPVTQRQILQRVYGKSTDHRQYTSRALHQCHRRALENHRYFDQFRDHPIYGAAFAKLADEALEHCHMLRRML